MGPACQLDLAWVIVYVAKSHTKGQEVGHGEFSELLNYL